MEQIIEKNKLEKKSTPDFLTPIENELNILEVNLTNKLSEEGKLLSDIIKHIFSAGGKRLRPALCFLIAKGTGEIKDKHYIQAELTELIHTASLIHDDIIDSANFRRGKETISNLWNNKVSVIAGDFLFAQASVRLGEVENNEIVKIYAKVLSDLCDGEIEQFTYKFNTTISWDYYIQKSTTKTASLFSGACKGAAIINNQSPEVIKKANDFGLNLGIAFQIVDDILDFTSSSKDLGKDVCSDLKQGLVTAPTLYALIEKNEKSNKLKTLIESRFNNN